MRSEAKCGHYILVGQTPVACDSLFAWGEWMATGDRQVAETFIDRYHVSTVFLGLDHRWPRGSGEPILFETMIFLEEAQRRPDESLNDWSARHTALTEDDPLVEHATRARTWLEAEQDHEQACLLVEAATGSPRRGVQPILHVQPIQTNEAGAANEAMTEIGRILKSIRGARRIRTPKKGKDG